MRRGPEPTHRQKKPKKKTTMKQAMNKRILWSLEYQDKPVSNGNWTRDIYGRDE